MARWVVRLVGPLLFILLVSILLLQGGVASIWKDWIDDGGHKEKIHIKLPYSKAITNDMIDNLNAPLPNYLANTTNPCWYEDYPSDSLYGHNGYRIFYAKYAKPLGSMNRYFKQMSNLVEQRRTQEGLRLRCLPSAYIIGFPKCGTTDLYTTLKLHPAVSRDIPLKELNFWHTHRFNRLPGAHKNFYNSPYFKTFSDYLDLFDQKILKDWKLHKDKLIVDATPTYIWNFPDWKEMSLNRGKTEPSVIVAHLIRHFTPHAKFLITLRNPTDLSAHQLVNIFFYLYYFLDSVFSHYFFHGLGLGSNVDFHERLVQSIQVMKQCTSQKSLRTCVYDPVLKNSTQVRLLYVLHSDVINQNPSNLKILQVKLEIGHFAIYIRDWFSVFPREQFHISRLEDFSQKKKRTMKDIVRFLGIRPSHSFNEMVEFTSKRVGNKNKNYNGTRMLPESRKLLDEYFAESNRELASLLNDPRYRYDASLTTMQP